MTCRCGIPGCTGCDAEASLAELRAMKQGRAPARCVRITAAQLAALEDLPSTPCHHRGPAVSTRPCDSCRGHVQIKIYACDLHGQCTIATPLDGAACCDACPDYGRRTA